MTFCLRKPSLLLQMTTSKQSLSFLQKISHNFATCQSKSSFKLQTNHILLSFMCFSSQSSTHGHNNNVKSPAHRKIKYQRSKSKFKKSKENYYKDHHKFMKDRLDNTPNGEYLFGRTVCEMAIKASRRPIFRLLLHFDWQTAMPDDSRVHNVVQIADNRGIPIEYARPSMLEEISTGRPHQGISMEVGQLTLISVNEENLSTLLPDKLNAEALPLWVLLYNVGDPMNVGAILRSCNFLGVDKVFMTKQCAPLSSTTSKASSGAAEVMPIYSTRKPLELLKVLGQKGWEIIGTDVPENEACAEDIPVGLHDDDANNSDLKKSMLRSEDISQIQLLKPSLVIFGSEGTGIPANVQKHFTKTVTVLPHSAGENSVPCLNVSAAAAIILHQLSKKATPDNS